MATYVALSRLRSLAQLYLHGVPDRKVIEGGPPKAGAAALESLFGDNIERTQITCKEARKILGWHESTLTLNVKCKIASMQ